MRKIRTITAHYIPVEWGVKVGEKDLRAWVRMIRTEGEKEYTFYGDDADVYREFEHEGFTISKTFGNITDAHKWLNQEIGNE